MTSGGSRGGALSLFLHQTEARRAEKILFGDQPSPLYLRVWMTGSLPRPASLKVWIRH